MKRSSRHRCAAVLALGLLCLPGARAQNPGAEDTSSAAVLLGRARTLEGRGRLDLARQNWLEVLSVAPNNAEALAGLVRAARAAGHPEEARQYLERLRSAHPGDPELARLGTEPAPERPAKAPESLNADAAEAARLAQTGDPQGAMVIYRRLYGGTPPNGAPALAYYETEAATPEGRPTAIAGLRALHDRFPGEPRYAVVLGRLLLASPRTHEEGRTLLERYPADPAAVAALHAGGVVAPSTANASGKPLTLPTGRSTPPTSGVHSVAGAGERIPGSAAAHPAGRSNLLAEEQAGYAALNQHRNAEAEGIFRGILARDPSDARALAGLGYVSSATGDLKSAVNYFEQAQEHGDRSLALTRAMVNAQFSYALGNADAAVARGDLPEAQQRYTDALRERPTDAEALDGLGEVLLRRGQLTDAIPVFARLTIARPMSPAAWRGLVVADAGAGRPAEALAADARTPPEVRAPLTADARYQQALASARTQVGVPAGTSAAGTLVARATPTSPAPSPAPKPSPPVAATAAVAVRPSEVPAPAASARPRTQPPVPSQSAAASTVPPPRAADSSLSARVSPPAAVPASRATENAAVPHSARLRNRLNRAPAARAEATPEIAVTPAVPPPPTPSPDEAIASERITQGETALQGGDFARAADLFRQAVAHGPQRADAWKGLITALHAQGRDGEAITALGSVPPLADATLARDATLQQVAGAAYLKSDRPQEALQCWARAQSIFASQRLLPPLELALDVARLLAARGDDGDLYRQLMYLGARKDLADTQRREVQLVWTRWAVRRARTLAADGDQPRAVVVLNAAAEAFAGNPAVPGLIADGYAGVGLPREAVALYRAQDPTRGTEDELLKAVRAATAAHDYRTAEAWVRAGRERFPSSAPVLTAAAELQQARGHEGRAADLTRQARVLAPAQDAGQVLTAELRESPATPGIPTAGRLAVLLLPDAATVQAATQAGQPFLPGAMGGSGKAADPAATPALAEGLGSSR